MAAGMGLVFPSIQALAANAVTADEQGIAAGSVIAVQGMAMVVAPLVYAQPGYDAQRDFKPVSLVSRYKFALAVSAGSAAIHYAIQTLTRAGDNIVCMLPMAHTYGLAFEILNSISMGCHIHFLGKTPSPKVLLDAFAGVKPKLVLAVPLIIEKIVTRSVFPKLKKGAASVLINIPLLNKIVHTKVRKSMIDFFGGNLVEVVIGGAALNSNVEKFLRKIRFPYTVGYGMTECGPLISYSFWSEFKERSCGRVVDRMQVKIDSPDPANVAGEILAKGTNVMLGYYKNEEATQKTFTADGWLKTGDLGTLDKDNFVFIRGRDKNMILGASGQNIYPEEIEERINASPFVEESLAIEEEGKITVLIVPNRDALGGNGTPEADWDAFFSQVITEVNAKLPAYSQLASFRLREEEFEKTPKRSIKRFKYQP